MTFKTKYSDFVWCDLPKMRKMSNIHTTHILPHPHSHVYTHSHTQPLLQKYCETHCVPDLNVPKEMKKTVKTTLCLT